MIQDPTGPLTTQRMFERFTLQQSAAFQPRGIAVGVGLLLGQGPFVAAEDHVDLPLPGEAIAILDHLRDLVAGIDVYQRKRDMTEEGLPRQPEQDRAVLADRPEHHQLLEAAIGLAQDENALRFDDF